MHLSKILTLWNAAITLGTCTAAPLISEFAAANSNSLRDGNGNSTDWIEIYNPDLTPVDLVGYTLSDDHSTPSKWIFPSVTLSPNKFLIVFASGENQPDLEGNLHTNFKLKSQGDYLSFSNPTGAVLSEFLSPVVNFPPLATDVSYGLAFISPPPINEDLVLIGNGVEGNGSFEDTEPSTNPSGSGSPTRWAANGSGQIATIDGWSAIWRGGFVGFDDGAAASDGTNYGFVNHNSDASFDSAEHPVTLQIGDVLKLDFDLTTNIEGGEVTVVVELRFENGGNERLARYSYITSVTGLYDLQSFEYIVGEEHAGDNAVSVRIRLDNDISAPVDQPRFDNVRLTRTRPSSIDLVDSGTPAHWLVPENDNLGTTWSSPSFDDSSWTEGNTPLGYESNPGSTNSYESLISATIPNGTTSAYLRQSFVIADKDSINDLELALQYDDGFIAYLNGTLVAQQNAPTSPAFNSSATSDHPDAEALEFTEFSLTDHLDLLLNGENVLAIHALNTSGSSDFIINPILNANFGEIILPTLRQPIQIGRLAAPTPGTYNTELQASDVSFSRDSGLFTETFLLTLTPEIDGETVRYTLDDSEPDASSTVYNGPISVDSTTHIRARAFNEHEGPGSIFGASYVKMESGLADFSTHLPVIVIDNDGKGNPLDKIFRTAFTTVFEPNNETGETTLTSIPSLAQRSAWHRRGSSSFTQGKPNYRLEFRDQTDDDKDVPVLDLPADSDWILTTFARFDRAMMRNPVALDSSRELGIYAPRTRYVEVFFNQDGDDLEEDDYFGVYLLSENIKRGNDRVDIEKLDPSDKLTGGYIIKSDRVGSGDFTFRTNRGIPSESSLRFITVEPEGFEITDEQKNYISGYVQQFEDALYGENFQNADGVHYSEFIDIDAFIEQHLFQVFFKGPDALRFSTYFHKDRGGKLRFGPNWDQERIIGVESDTATNRARNPENWNGDGDIRDLFSHDWWDRLFEDPDFMQAWIDRWVNFQTVFNSDRISRFYNSYEASLLGDNPLDSPVTRNFNRWGDSASNGGSEAWPNSRIRTSNNTDSNNYYQFGDPSLTAGATDPEVSPTPSNILAYWRAEVSHVRSWTDQRMVWIAQALPERASISRPSGPLPLGTEVTLSASGQGQIYYTIDGSDPRAPGGEPSVSASLWDGTPITITMTQKLTVRVLDPDNPNPRDQVLGQPNRYDIWSAPSSAIYEVGPSLVSNLVFSEFSYNPLAPFTEEEISIPGIDNGDFEFIEFLNTHSTEAINLVGAHFTAGVKFTFGDMLLAPGARGIIVRNEEAFTARYGTGLNILGTFDGGLDGSGETLALADAFGNSIRSFTYDDSLPWPESPDGSGPSLVLISPFSLPDHNDAQSWRASLDENGTPGIRGGTAYSGDSPEELLAYALPGGQTLQHPGGSHELTIGINPFAEDVAGSFWISTDLDDWSLANDRFTRLSQSADGIAVYRFHSNPGDPSWFIQYRVDTR